MRRNLKHNFLTLFSLWKIPRKFLENSFGKFFWKILKIRKRSEINYFSRQHPNHKFKNFHHFHHFPNKKMSSVQRFSPCDRDLKPDSDNWKIPEKVWKLLEKHDMSAALAIHNGEYLRNRVSSCCGITHSVTIINGKLGFITCRVIIYTTNKEITSDQFKKNVQALLKLTACDNEYLFLQGSPYYVTESYGDENKKINSVLRSRTGSFTLEQFFQGLALHEEHYRSYTFYCQEIDTSHVFFEGARKADDSDFAVLSYGS